MILKNLLTILLRKCLREIFRVFKAFQIRKISSKNAFSTSRPVLDLKKPRNNNYCNRNNISKCFAQFFRFNSICKKNSSRNVTSENKIQHSIRTVTINTHQKAIIIRSAQVSELKDPLEYKLVPQPCNESCACITFQCVPFIVTVFLQFFG